VHIADGVMSLPVNLVGALVASASVTLVLRRFERSDNQRALPLLGVTSGFVFAAQMVNFPILPGASGHLLGGALATAILGPALAMLSLSVVLIVQCFAFADGGVSALGTNIVNLAIISPLSAYLVFRLFQWPKPQGALRPLVVALAAWLAVFIPAFLCSLELWLSERGSLSALLGLMAGTHALIGVGEALITAPVVLLVLQARPELASPNPPLTQVFNNGPQE
jgi:cobalt/nickel transport system permease protein